MVAESFSTVRPMAPLWTRHFLLRIYEKLFSSTHTHSHSSSHNQDFIPSLAPGGRRVTRFLRAGNHSFIFFDSPFALLPDSSPVCSLLQAPSSQIGDMPNARLFDARITVRAQHKQNLIVVKSDDHTRQLVRTQRKCWSQTGRKVSS